MVRRSFACVCAVVALVEFHAFVGMKTQLRRSYKLQSLNAGYGDRFLTKAQNLLGVQGHDENVTSVALELALAEKDQELAQELALAEKEKDAALALAETKYRLLQLKYLSVSSRFWLETMFKEFVAFLRTTRLSLAPPITNSKINTFLVNNPQVWQKFALQENISLRFPVNESFPRVSRPLLYGRLSEPVHAPPGLVVLDLWEDMEYTSEVYLLRDLGVHYSHKLQIVAEPLELSQALADLMKTNRRQ